MVTCIYATYTVNINLRSVNFHYQNKLMTRRQQLDVYNAQSVTIWLAVDSML